MDNRGRTMAILNYKNFDRIPVLHFSFLPGTLKKWCDEGHLTKGEIEGFRKTWSDGSKKEDKIARKLGFDFNWYSIYHPKLQLFPYFEIKILEEMSDGFRKVQNHHGAIELQRDGAGSIPAEVGHLLKGRREWEEYFLPRLKFSMDRIDMNALEKMKNYTWDKPVGLYCGSLFGIIRNWMGIEGLSYLYIDDQELYDEIINTVAELSYKVTEKVLSSGVKFDFAHFWEDICFKNGPLVNPSVFAEKIGPHYKRITDLLKRYGTSIVSLDCDGLIDSLIPTWINNGVNTMFPIEVGTWEATILPWRKKYGKKLRGIGGMRKNVFSEDYSAVDKEIERLKPLIELGGYIPCPDHRIPENAKWENVQYYCDRMHSLTL